MHLALGMMTFPVTRAVVIENPQGLHARPAELFARLASTFEARIVVMREDQCADGKSILEILTLGVQPGTELVLEAHGNDAQQAIDALTKLVRENFEGSGSGSSESPE